VKPNLDQTTTLKISAADTSHQVSSAQPLDQIDEWAARLLANPITKMPALLSDFKVVNGIIDARVLLKNTYGYKDWVTGQAEYESWVSSLDTDAISLKNTVLEEIERDRATYSHFKLNGDILDVGGGFGLLREFLPLGARLISIDPFIEALNQIPKATSTAYTRLNSKLNFIGGLAEFLPFQKESFDWVHMRSMLDHVQVPDLAIKEALRVLKTNGVLLVGLYVEGGEHETVSPMRRLKNIVKHFLEYIGIERYKDFHTWHPSYKNLLKLIEDNGFIVQESFWQPGWNNEVVYVAAKKTV
jgi:ubiquinone/menaquinone biosynthesis C-methylase UbiE